MRKITILSVGKNKERWLEEAVQEYVKRLSSWAQIVCEWVKDDHDLLKRAEGLSYAICLDPNGKEFNSESLSVFLENIFVEQGARLVFIIGGPEGLPEVLLKRFFCISFSKLTFTHQIARLILLEQIYRCEQILKGSPYHK